MAPPQQLIGAFRDCTAFPVRNAQGTIVGCHYVNGDGEWRHFPNGTKTSPFILGDVTVAARVWAFESQWDMLSVANTFSWNTQPLDNTALVATRGAGNSRMLRGLCSEDTMVFAFAQNDDAGAKWLAGIAKECGCPCFHVITPSPHKDVNDWTRAGANADDLQRAIETAERVGQVMHGDAGGVDLQDSSKAFASVLVEDNEQYSRPFPLDCLPPKMATLAAGIARTARVPERLTGVCTLGLVSAAIGSGLEVKSDTNRTTSGNLYLIVSAETGTGKSRTFELIAQPLLNYQERLQKRWLSESGPRLESDLKILERELASLEKKIAKTNVTEERERLRALHEAKTAQKHEIATLNHAPVLFVQDVTTERLAVMMQEQGEVLFSASSDSHHSSLWRAHC